MTSFQNMIAKTLMLINVFYHVVVKTPCTDNVRHRIKYGNVLKISKGLCELRQCIHTIIKIETSVKVRLTLLTDSSILFWGESPNPCASYMLIFATYRPKEHKFAIYGLLSGLIYGLVFLFWKG